MDADAALKEHPVCPIVGEGASGAPFGETTAQPGWGGLAQNRSDLFLEPAGLWRSVSSGKFAVAQARFLMIVTGTVALDAQKNAGARRVAPAVRLPILQAYQHRDMRKQAPQLTLDRVKSKLVGKDGLDGQGIRGERSADLRLR